MRGKAKYTYISAGSNTTVKSGPGSLYKILSSNPTGSTIVLDDSVSLGQAPNFNSATAGTIGNIGGALLDFEPGLGFNTGLTVAASSNARLLVVYE
jgi:hypothetical protein